ncbi:MAG: GNAT family N-acetyltransferase [Lewinellaceae bacterium]|nr:GNAT family N-acetyltransferase [Saprospiraceae bacterium]MCB9345725.1 GNAT family N-acetyltransferase [Lewinellaceae bacterium]
MTASMIDSMNKVIEYGLDRNILQHHTEDTHLTGRTITLNGQSLLNFGSCSYLGLEQHAALKNGAMDAIQQYGTQFSSSRSYASLGLYRELEDGLRDMFGKPVVVTASTTLGHLATIPIIIGEQDAVILDMQVHSSVQMTSQMLKAQGVPLSIIKHNDMEMLEEKIKSLNGRYKKIWYFADGVYSMYGDYAPLKQIVKLLDKYPSFHLYIDDAHGMSWAGKHGCGYVRSQIEHHDKMVLAGSLNKSFATAGGMIIFPNDEMAQRVRNCGGTMIFCGPIQPPMLGAACASLRLHRSQEIEERQQELAEKIQYTNDRISALGLPQFEISDSPLFFIPVGLPAIIAEMIKRIHADGIFINSASFPAVPMKRGGLRFMINGNMTYADIDRLLESVAKHYPLVLEEFGSSTVAVAKTFDIEEISLASAKQIKPAKEEVQFDITFCDSVKDIAANEWDTMMVGKGNFTHANLCLLEDVFSDGKKPEEKWGFQYLIVKDKDGKTVLATFYTCAMMKDDLLSPASVSEQIEQIRLEDPYYLTSKCVLLGSPITKGDHLYLDRTHKNWKQALQLLIRQMQETVEEQGATQLMLREFAKDTDLELKECFLELGLTEMDLLNVCKVEDTSWKDQEEYLERLGGKYRYNVRKEILPFLDQFELVTEKPQTEEEMRDCYALYEQVQQQAYAMNMFKLPYEFFKRMCADEKHDILRLYSKEDGNSKPVAVMFSFMESAKYDALIVGLDYNYVRSHNIYKQMLYLTVWRAWELGCSEIDLAYTAELEKKKVGARPVETIAFVQAMDHFNHAVIASISQTTKLERTCQKAA